YVPLCSRCALAPRSPLFPYTTLFRSRAPSRGAATGEPIIRSPTRTRPTGQRGDYTPHRPTPEGTDMPTGPRRVHYMLTHKLVTDVVERALTEDCPWGDATVAVSIPADLEFQANLVAREPGFFAGGAVLVETFQQVDPRIVITNLITDGTAFSAGDVLASLSGPAAGILTGERVALNFVQRLSGIATLTSLFVAHVAGVGSHARIADTRKTTPGLRALEKHAVTAGGGINHRFSLSDAIMFKDNHLAALGVTDSSELTEAIQGVKAKVGHTTAIIVEV